MHNIELKRREGEGVVYWGGGAGGLDYSTSATQRLGLASPGWSPAGTVILAKDWLGGKKGLLYTIICHVKIALSNILETVRQKNNVVSWRNTGNVVCFRTNLAIKRCDIQKMCDQ